jgi:hypothetical protein
MTKRLNHPYSTSFFLSVLLNKISLSTYNLNVSMIFILKKNE